MIARIKPCPSQDTAPAWHAGFLAMLPHIRRYARACFRHLNPEAREEATHEVVCNALRAYVRLVELDKAEIAYPRPLACYGVLQVKDGRKVGSRRNINDVTSPYAQRQKGFDVKRLDRFDRQENAWREIVIEDRRAGPAEVARVRLDFADWLKTLSRRYRRIVQTLATGEKPGIVAKRFRLSAGRISQIRRELMMAWERFQGQDPVPATA